MTREEKISRLKDILSEINENDNAVCYLTSEDNELIESAIEALEQQPYEKFESAKDHIYKLAGDYKCWDNRLTEDEAVELCHILEQEPCYNPDEWCHDCSEYDHDKHCCPRYNKVIRSAVEEMKQEPCEDAISRNIAVANVQELAKLHPNDANNLNRVVKCLETLPPVQPKPKTGQWALLDECSNSGYYCSECHKKLVKEGWSDTVKKIKYCPNCGAKMQEVEDGNK